MPTVEFAAPDEIGGRVDRLEKLTHNEGNAATGGLWRVHGPAGTAVLKVAQPPQLPPTGSPSWQTSDEPTHFNYWKRESLAYATGLVETAYAGTGIEPAALIRIHERPDGAVEVWLRDIAGVAGTSWSAERLGRFARQLGQAQAAWIGRVPPLPWLSCGWLRQYLAHGPSRIAAESDPSIWQHPAAAVWPESVRQQLSRLWADRLTLLDEAEAVTRTLCHLDVWPTNLIAVGDTSVLLDWAFVGEGGLGEDVANLIVDSVTDGLMDMALLPDIVEACADGYVAGLADGGWTGPADAIRRAIKLFGVVKYSWFAPAVLGRVVRNEQALHVQYGQDKDSGEAMLRLRPLVTTLAAWSEAVR